MNIENKIKNMIKLIGSEGYKDGSSTKIGWVYHPIPFSEFNPPIHKTSSIDEYNIIDKDYNGFTGKRILDVGCANGYFSFNMAMAGADSVIGYESDKFVYDVNEEIRKYKNINNVKFICEHFDNDTVSSLENFDIVVMLNIHMWIRKQIGENKTLKMMQDLRKKTIVMYFQTAHVGGRGGYMVPELKSRQDIEIYLKKCGFNKVTCLGKSQWFDRFMFKCE